MNAVSPSGGLQPEWRDLLLIVILSGGSVAVATESQSKDPYIANAPSRCHPDRGLQPEWRGLL